LGSGRPSTKGREIIEEYLQKVKEKSDAEK
jgi:hypothetical protein